MDIILKPQKVTLFLSLIVGFLTLANAIGLVFKFHFGNDLVYGLVPLFDVDTEGNIPSTYSSLSLLFCSALLSIITSEKRKNGDPYTRYWLALAVIFLFLSIDEAATIHEHLNRPVRTFLKTSGALYNAWIIPYGIFLAILGLLYLKFLKGLPKRTRWLFVVACAVFVTGALGLDVFSGSLNEAGRRGSLSFAVVNSAQELLEMVGVVVFIYALTSYMDSEIKETLIRISTGRTPNNC
jgi:hypothetical protein